MITVAIILIVFSLAIAILGVRLDRALKRERDRTIEGLDAPSPPEMRHGKTARVELELDGSMTDISGYTTSALLEIEQEVAPGPGGSAVPGPITRRLLLRCIYDSEFFEQVRSLVGGKPIKFAYYPLGRGPGNPMYVGTGDVEKVELIASVNDHVAIAIEATGDVDRTISRTVNA